MNSTTCTALGVAILSLLLVVVASPAARAVTVVNFGTVGQFSGPADLDLDGDIIYAVSFSAGDPVRTVNGVNFTPDNAPPAGFSSVGPNEVTNWQTKPEFGATADDDQLEEVMADIRWADTGAAQFLSADMDVEQGQQYKLQILISANHAGEGGGAGRIWDIQIDGQDAVDEIRSWGLDTDFYSIDRSTVYSYEFTAPDNQLNVVMAGNLFGASDATTDRNPIWQGIILEKTTVIPEPSSLLLAALGGVSLIAFVWRRRRQRPALR